MNDSYSPAERLAILDKMRAASDSFYSAAVRTGCHAFIEFTGLMNEYIKICRRASEAGVDFTRANVHSGVFLTIEAHEHAYMREKIECIFGHTFSEASLKAEPQPVKGEP